MYVSQLQRNSKGHEGTTGSPVGALGHILKVEELGQARGMIQHAHTEGMAPHGSWGKAYGKHHATRAKKKRKKETFAI